MNIEDTIDRVVADISENDFRTCPPEIMEQVIELNTRMDIAHEMADHELFDSLVEQQVHLVEHYFRNQQEAA